MSCDTYDLLPAPVWREGIRRARKDHRCDACNEPIPRGHKYSYTFAVVDGDPQTTKRCLRCDAIYERLSELLPADQVCDITLDCGHSWSDIHDGPPPEDLVALAFATPEEMQAKHAAAVLAEKAAAE